MIAVVVRCALTLLALTLASEASAQVFQTGSVIPQHLMMWSGSNVAQDAGGSAPLPQGLQPTQMGLVAAPNISGAPFPATATGNGPNGENSCIYDSPLGIGGHYLCMSANLGSNTGAITFGSEGGGPVGAFEFIVNGTKIPFPGPGTGTVVGPATSVIGDLACWANVVGTQLSDCGILASNILTTSAAAIIYAPLASPALTGTPTSTTPATADNSTKIATTAFVKAQGYLTSTSVPVPSPQGRLTLQSRTPVMVTNQTNKATIFYDSYVGNDVPVYNGTVDVLLPIGGNEISLVLTASEESSAQTFDVWAINVSGTLTLCTATNGAGASGTGWSGDTGGSNTARGTGYSQLSFGNRSYVTNANSIANCFGGVSGTTNFGLIPANQASYLGTYVTNAAGTTTFNIVATQAVSNSQMFIWNYYNRVSVLAREQDSGSNYTYTASVVRQAGARTNNNIAFVQGVSEEPVTTTYSTNIILVAAQGATVSTGVSLDVTNSFNWSPATQVQQPVGGAGGINAQPTSVITGYPGPGLHVFFATETGDNVNANTFNSVGSNLLTLQLRN